MLKLLNLIRKEISNELEIFNKTKFFNICLQI